MNAAEKQAEILKKNGYHYAPVQSTEYWFLGVSVVACDISYAKATAQAYAHYERRQEALAQAANDAAGEAAYNEVVAETDDLQKALDESEAWHAQSIDYGKAIEADNATLRQQLADAQAKVAELEAVIAKTETKSAFFYRALQTLAEDSGNWSQDRMRRFAKAAMYPTQEELDSDFQALQEAFEQPAPVPVADAPATPARMRVKWGERGFSSGAYEVISTNAAKQAYVLNISTDASKPMPKLVKMADCQPVN